MRISSLTALLIGWPLFQHAVAVCPSGLGRKCKECTNENSGWETDCTLRVRLGIIVIGCECLNFRSWQYS